VSLQRPPLLASVLLLATLLCLPGQAAPITVVNHSFEDISGETVSNEFTFGPLNGWDLYDPGNITGGGAGGTFFIGTLTPQPDTDTPDPNDFINFPAGAPDGQRVGLAFNFEGSEDTGEYGFEQTLTMTLQPNTEYTLEVDIGNIASGQSLGAGFFSLDGFPGYRVDLIAGGLVLASDNNSLDGSIPEGEFRLSTVGFTTGSSHAQLGQNLGIRLVNLNQGSGVPAGNDIEVDFDNVRLDASPVPEPSGALLLLTALAALASRHRRR